ncbi:probable serine/threonine-protein kinase fhkE [Diaphorina citri]|uniref:Probable serine/threonine-protein kinase fhkE n=1 Tax=Diaphorina citri TaxID=121845 RepID=A0A3Q0IKJ8_DIACI|nr:probable serine/threonine-protein kinase fhkE [Diaphorina citri]
MSQCFHEPISTETNDYDELPDTPVLDVSPASDSFEFPHLWGTLVCIDSQMEHTELLENEYTFGRDYHNVDFVLKHSSISNCNFSKKHFTIGFNGNTREAYIIDNSTNGTFVDSKKLSKNEKHNLLHLNRISAISDKNKGKFEILNSHLGIIRVG